MRGIPFSWFTFAFVVSMTFGCVGEATPRPAQEPPKSFKECVEQGGKILKSYPAQCVTPEGLRFIQNEGSGNHPAKGERACKDLCGNGRCEEIVCMAIGCPCAESPKTCPQDCKE